MNQFSVNIEWMQAELQERLGGRVEVEMEEQTPLGPVEVNIYWNSSGIYCRNRPIRWIMEGGEEAMKKLVDLTVEALLAKP